MRESIVSRLLAPAPGRLLDVIATIVIFGADELN
jgi:hypothetical protein